MKLSINAIMDGTEILQSFVLKLKENNIETIWKEGSLPNGIKILITNKTGQDIEISPEKLKIVFNKD